MTPFRLEPAMQVAKQACDDAAAKLGRAMQRLQQADQQLQTLLRYREEYQERFRSTVAGGIDSHGWSNFHAFMDKLESAIAGALEQSEKAREAARRAQEAWTEQRRKVKAYDVLAQRHQRAEAAQEARREQHVMDERATTSHRLRPPTVRLR